MPDYDLGTAHGQITIEEDRKKNDQVISALNDIRDNVRRLDTQIHALNNTLEDYAHQLKNTTLAMNEVATSIRDGVTQNRQMTVSLTGSVAAMRNMSKATVTTDLKTYAKDADGVSRSVEKVSVVHNEATRASRALSKGLLGTRTAMKLVAGASTTASMTIGRVAGELSSMAKTYVGLEQLTFDTKNLTKSFIRLGIGIATVDSKMVKWTNVIRNVNTPLQGIKGAAVGAGNAIRNIGRASEQASDGIQAASNGMAAAAAESNRMTNALKGTARWAGKTSVDFGRSLFNSASKLTYKFVGLKKAMAELPPVMQIILRISSLFLGIGNALQSLGATKVGKLLGTAFGTASASLQKFGVLVGTTTAKLIGMAGVIESRIIYALRLATVASGRFLIALAPNIRAASIALQGGVRSLAAWSARSQSAVFGNKLFTRSLKGLAAVIPGVGVALAKLSNKAGVSLTSVQKLIRSNGNLEKALIKIQGVTGKTTKELSEFGRALRSMGPGLNRLAGGLTRFSIGFALIKKAVTGFRDQVRKATLVLQLFGLAFLALQGAGAIILGLGDAIKQMAKTVAVLPGLLLAIGTTAVVGVMAFKRLKESFSAAKKDGQEFTDAIAKMSPQMKSIAIAAHDLKDGYKELGSIAADTTFRGFEESLKNIGEAYLPTLKAGFKSVGGGLNRFVSGFTKFLGEKQTLRDMNTIFTDTGHIVGNVGKATQPALEAFRDLGVVGLQSMKEMTASASQTANVFAAFIKNARDTGQIKVWIADGVQGIKDFGNVIKNTGGAVKDFFKGLGYSGENALHRMNRSLLSVRDGIKGLTDNGTLGLIGDRLDRLGKFTGTAIREAFTVLRDLFEQSGEKLNELSLALSSGFIQAIRTLGSALQIVVAVLANIPGNAQFLALIASSAILAKFLKFLISPIVRVTALFIGLFQALKGATIAIAGYTAAVAAGAKGGAVMQAILGRWRITALGAQAAIGALGIAAAAAFIAFAMWRSDASTQKTFQQDLARDTKKTAESFDEFRDSVYDAQGAIDPSSIEAMSAAMDGLLGQLETKANHKGTAWQGFVDGMQNTAKFIALGTSGDLFGDGDTSDTADEQAEKYRRAKEALDSLKYSNEDLARVVTSSDGTYAAFTERLRGISPEAGLAAEKMDEARQKFVEVRDTAAAIGPQGLALADALQKIGEEGSSSTSKLDGLKQALRALGLLQTDAQAAAFEYQEEIRKLGDAASYAVDPMGKFGQALVENGTLNARAGTNAATLNSALTGIGEKFLAQASAGGDVNQMYKDLLPGLDELGRRFGFTLPGEIRKLAETYGVIPRSVETLVALQGSDAVARDVAQMSLLLGNISDKPYKIAIQTTEAKAELEKAGLIVDNFNASLQTGEVRLKPGTNVAQVAAGLQQYLKDHVVVDPKLNPNAPANIKNQLTPDGKPIDLPVKPKIDPSWDPKSVATKADGSVDIEAQYKKFGKAPEAPAPQQATTKAPGGEVSKAATEPEKKEVEEHTVKTTEIKILNADVAKGAIDGVIAALKSLPPETNTIIKVNAADVALGAVQGVLAELRKMPPNYTTTIRVMAADVALGAVQGVKVGIDQLAASVKESEGKWGELANTIRAKVTEAQAAVSSMTSAIGTTLVNAATNAANSGRSLGQGFADGIRSKADEARKASMALAEAAARPLPRSPAKEGPFSGKGWTPYRGESLAVGFADGIASGTKGAKSVALDLAEAVASAINTAQLETNGLLGVPTSFDANRPTNPGGHKYYRDGDVSEADLIKNRKDRQKEEDQKAKDEDYRASKKATKSLPKQQEKLTDAQERVQKAEERLAKAKGKETKSPAGERDKSETIKNAEESLQKAKEAQTKAESDLQKAKTQIESGPTSLGGSGDSSAIDKTVRSLDSVQYGMGEFNKAMLDCSAFVSGIANEADGRDFFSERGNTTNLEDFLSKRGFVKGKGGEGDLSVAWWDEGGGANGHTALTTPSGMNAESTTGGVRYGDESAGARSNNQQFTDFMYKPMEKSLDKTTKAIETSTIDSKSTSLTKDEVARLIIAQGKEQGASDQDILSALETGIVESGLQNLAGGDRDSVGTFQQRNSAPWTNNGRNRNDVKDAAASFYDQMKANGQGATPGQRAQSVQRSAFPDKYDQTEAEAKAILERIGTDVGTLSASSGESEPSAEEAVAILRAQDKTLNQTLSTLDNSKASDAEVIRSLQDLDDRINATEDPDIRDALKGIKDNTMSDRGIKEYDPEEGKSTDPMADVMGIAQNIVGIYEQVNSGIDGFKQLTELLVRGFENTADVGTAIDGFQSLVSSITSVIDTVTSIASTITSLAALAGAAIPGVGQVTAAISAVTGGIGNINAIIDLAQQVSSIVGRGLGTIASFLAGGKDGALMGDVKMLLDTNDQTLKRWGSDNPLDKRSTSLDPFNRIPDRDVGGTGSNQFNIYANPNAPASEIINEAMYAVRLAGVGAIND